MKKGDDLGYEKGVGNFTTIENDFLDSTGFADIYEKMIYISLRRFMNMGSGAAFPGVKRLAAMSMCSERKVREAIKGLEEGGWLNVERRVNKTSVYTFKKAPTNRTLGPDQRAGHNGGAGSVMRSVQTNNTIFNKTSNNNTVVFQRLYDLYQSKDIIKHTKPTQEMKDAVRSRLKSYSPEQLEQAINNYATVLKSHDHYFSYKYGFADLMRAKDVRKFVDEADPINNFRKKSFGQPAMQPVPPQPKPVDLNNLFTAGEDW